MVCANNPYRTVLAQQPPGLSKPLPREAVIGVVVREPVPVFIDTVNKAIVRAAQFALQLQVVGRVREHAVHGCRRKHAHQAQAIAQQYLVER